MTTIVGLVHEGWVYLGGDSSSSSGNDCYIRADPKVFQLGEMVIGFTGSFRMGNLLRHIVEPPATGNHGAMGYLVGPFVTEVRRAFAEHGFLSKAEGADRGGSFLVGFRGKLYLIDGDFQVGEIAGGYYSIGSGSDVAVGAMFATKKMKNPEARITLALEAAAEHSVYTRPPYIFARTL